MQITPKHSKDAREMLTLSQSVVGRGAELSRTYLSQWENESKILPDRTLIRLQAYYEKMGYEFPAGDGVSQEPAPAPSEAPADPLRPAVPPARAALPYNVYQLDGYLIPKGIRRGVAENILDELHAGEALIADYLGDATEVEPVVSDGGWTADEEVDPAPAEKVENQRAAALAVMAVMARNYLLLVRLRGDDEFDAVEIASGEDHSPEYLMTNAGVIAQALSHAPADIERLNVAV